MAEGKPSLGFIGLGLMGRPMTGRLLEAGYPVIVWNRSRGKVEPLVAQGATAAESPAAVAAAAEFVMLCVTDTRAVEAVVFGPGGIAEARGARVLVDFSSIRPDATRDMAARLEAANGMGWVDAPVSGGVPGAEAGSLVIMAGGETADVEAVRPVMACLSRRFSHMGPRGAGQTTKLVNQIIVSCNLAVIAEAINFARRLGVDPMGLFRALEGGFADSRPFQLFGPRMAAGEFDDHIGALHTMLKDVDTARDLARAADAALPMTATAGEIYRQAAARGLAEADIATLITLYDPPVE